MSAGRSGICAPPHIRNRGLPGDAGCNNPPMTHPNEPAAGRYGVGQPVYRTEDPVLLRGEGRYTDDLNEPGQAYAWMVRSPHAHGILKNISVSTKISEAFSKVRTSVIT